jgi:hypothetical protein
MSSAVPSEDLQGQARRVVLEFCLTEAEDIASSRRLLLRRHGTRVSIVIGLVALAAGAATVGSFPFPGAMLLTVGVVSVVLYGAQ